MICSKCTANKSEDEFNFRNRANAHYQNNPDQYKNRARRRSHDAQTSLLNYLKSHPCVDCGEDDPIVLQFDHVNGKKFKAVTTLANHGYSWSTIENEISKCLVRCANCHARETARRSNAFRYRMVVPAGLEPATPSFVAKYSNPLSYGTT